ncbi:MAG: UDP-N-acetylglucosamine 1-carboxyvinyltransferase [Candidatus Omnitrophica bacterium]|nr:UDP-N-acetylglucosamine 1-carboxyvinyltransferase [Candidatus Omnitrophota bacterium]
MDSIQVEKSPPLHGEVQISGSKNAALPIMAAALLCDEPVVLGNVPDLADIHGMERLLCSMGGVTHYDSAAKRLSIDPSRVRWIEAPYDLVRKMRASFFVLGPLVGRHRHARVSMPGGCAIGARPVNIHLKALESLGVRIEVEHGYVVADGSKLRGGPVNLDFPSVGATENALCAAVLAPGETVIENAAREPEVTDLADFLVAGGGKIEGQGTSTIHVQGVDRLSVKSYPIIPDRIEAGTYLAAAALAGGEVRVRGCRQKDLTAFLADLRQTGTELEVESQGSLDDIVVRRSGPIQPISEVVTLPFPGFPTDLQAQMMAVLCLAEGASIVRETIFENRFMHVSELNRMGADITINGNTAIVRGVKTLSGSPVMASDLRASAALVISGLVARGTTDILRVYHLDRGYEHIETKLAGLGAKVKRVRTGA